MDVLHREMIEMVFMCLMLPRDIISFRLTCKCAYNNIPYEQLLMINILSLMHPNHKIINTFEYIADDRYSYLFTPTKVIFYAHVKYYFNSGVHEHLLIDRFYANLRSILIRNNKISFVDRWEFGLYVRPGSIYQYVISKFKEYPYKNIHAVIEPK